MILCQNGWKNHQTVSPSGS